MTLALPPLILLALYGLYLLKRWLGIDFFPQWGLHLPGPTLLLRRLVAKWRG
jgi:hypothetical protein